MKNLDLRQFSEVMVALLAQKGISCRLGENNGRIGIIYEEAGIKASTDVTLLWQKYGADYDVTELADVLYKAITSEVQKKKAEMPNPKPEQQVQPQISRPQMRTQPGRVTQQPMPDDMGGKMQIKCFNGIPGQNCAPLFEGSFDSPEEAKAAIAGFMKNVLNADDASVAELMKEFDARTRDAEAPKQQVKKPEPGDTARLVKNMFNMSDDEANDFLANLLKADLERQERQSAYNQPAPASEPRKNTSKYTRNDVAEAEKAAKGLIKNLFGIDLPEDMHSTVYNMAADDKTGDKTDACRGCGKDCTCGSYPKLSKQPPKQPKQNFDFFKELFAQPARTSADPSELLESVYPAFITDEMLNGYDIEKVLHLPVFGMHLVYYVDDALAHKYDGLILSDKFPFLSLKAFETFEVTEDEINDAALANIKEKVRLEKISFAEHNALLITSDAPFVSCASILCDGLLYNTATALGQDKVFVLELQPNKVVVLGADEPLGDLTGNTLDYILKRFDKTEGKLLSTTVFCYDKCANTLYSCSFNN